MTKQLVIHPRKDELVAFGLGKLQSDHASQIEIHLESCSACCDTIFELQDDTFVTLVRKSTVPASVADISARNELSAAPDKTDRQDDLVTVDLDSGISGKCSATADLPRELQEHSRYKILKLIGRGGMGDVYKAHHTLMNRPVAIKVIRSSLVQNQAAVLRFQREVQAAARLQHHNIVTAFDAEQAGESHFLVTEFVDGVNLDEVVRRRGALPVDEACDYIRQAADGLQHAHEHGMVHRDIKPHNLMVVGQASSLPTEDRGKQDAYATVKILDFGLANLANETVAEGAEQSDPERHAPTADVLNQLTQFGTVMGTPDFIAPEQARDAHSADIRSDIYSLGCTFYMLLAGRAPFGKGSVLDKIKAHAETTAPPISECRDDVPADVETILQKMMAKSPAHRFPTPDEVARVLKAWSENSTVGPVSIPVRDGIEKPSHRKRIMAIAAGLLLPLLFAAGVIVYVATDTGKLEIHSDVTDVAGAKIVLKKDDEEYASFDLLPEEKFQTIRAGKYKVSLRGAPADLELNVWTKRGDTSDWGESDDHESEIVVYRGGGLLIEVTKQSSSVNDNAASSELMLLTKELDSELSRDPFDATVSALRQRLIDFRRRHYGQPDSIEAARLMTRFAWPADALNAADISASQLKIAGGGDAAKAPAELVAVLGDGRLKTWMGTNFVSFGKDESSLFTGSWNGVVREWNATTGELNRSLPPLINFPAKFAVSGDGTRIAVASGGTVRLVNCNSGKVLHEAIVGRGEIKTLTFTADGQRIAVAGGDGSVKIIQWNSGEIESLDGHGGEIRALAFSPAGDILASGGADSTIRLWPLAGGDAVVVKSGHVGRVHALAYSHDGKLLVSSGDDMTVRLWRVETGEAGHILRGHKKGVLSVAVSPNGKLIASGGMDNTVKLWNTESGVEQKTLHINDWAWSLAFSTDGKLLASTANQAAALWDIEEGTRLHVGDGHNGRVTAVSVAPSGDKIASAGYDGAIQVWNLKNNAIEWKYENEDDAPLYAIGFNVDGTTLAVGDEANVLTFLETVNGRKRNSVPGSQFPARGLAYSPDGKLVASCGENEIIVWDSQTGSSRKLLRTTNDVSHVWCLAFSPDGKLLASGSANGSLKVWDLETETIRNETTNGNDPLTDIEFSPDGRTLASVSWNSGPTFWDVATTRKFATDSLKLAPGLMPTHWSERVAICYSPDGSLCASSGFDGAVRIWDAETGSQLHAIQICPTGGRINDIGFTPEGRHIVTANGNGTLYVLRLSNQNGIPSQ